MSLLFPPFISMLSPRAHELEIVSEEEEEEKELGEKKHTRENKSEPK